MTRTAHVTRPGHVPAPPRRRALAFADVDGDGKADAIVVNEDRITVRRSTGSAFRPNEVGTTDSHWGVRNFFADITGDRKADAIVYHDPHAFW